MAKEGSVLSYGDSYKEIAILNLIKYKPKWNFGICWWNLDYFCSSALIYLRI